MTVTHCLSSGSDADSHWLRLLALTFSKSRSDLDQLVIVTSPFTLHSIVPLPRAQISSSDWVQGRRPWASGPGGLNRAASKAASESWGHKKIVKIFVVQILYRLVRPAHSDLHEGNSLCFLLRSNSYFLIQLKFNLSEKFAAATKLKICLMFSMHYLMAVTW